MTERTPGDRDDEADRADRGNRNDRNDRSERDGRNERRRAIRKDVVRAVLLWGVSAVIAFTYSNSGQTDVGSVAMLPTLLAACYFTVGVWLRALDG